MIPNWDIFLPISVQIRGSGNRKGVRSALGSATLRSLFPEGPLHQRCRWLHDNFLRGTQPAAAFGEVSPDRRRPNSDARWESLTLTWAPEHEDQHSGNARTVAQEGIFLLMATVLVIGRTEKVQRGLVNNVLRSLGCLRR